jgi:hypothetical protein
VLDDGHAGPCDGGQAQMLAQVQRQLPAEMHRYIDTLTQWGDANEMAMHAMEAFNEAQANYTAPRQVRHYANLNELTS